MIEIHYHFISGSVSHSFLLQHSNQLLLQLHTDLLGVGGVRFIEYYDNYDCGDLGSSCDFYFKKLTIFDMKGVVLNIGETSSTTNKTLQQVPELQSNFTFDLTTNTTVYMSLEIWNKKLLNDGDKIRTLGDLVIPFHEITKNTGWKDKKFTNSSAYLDIQFRLEKCHANFRGLGCNFCSKNYYTYTCDKYCIAVEGIYTCSYLGEKVCHENRTGVDCENCTEGWGGHKCQECAKDYYPKGLCNVRCSEVQSKFTCTKDGRKTCTKNWYVEKCDNCSEKYFGEFCEAFCKETERYNCSSSGEMVCLYNTTTVEDNCAKFSKQSTKEMVIGVTIGTPLLAVILTVVIVLMHQKIKKSFLNHDLDPTAEDEERSDSNISKGKSSNRDCSKNNLEEEETYVDITILGEDEEHSNSNLSKSKSSNRDCSKNNLKEEETYVDITILGDIRLE